ncbi:MAG: hypothetical protein AAF598_10540 [Bacteroidota bacterium]
MKHHYLFFIVLAFLITACCKTKDRTLGFDILACVGVTDEIGLTLDTLDSPFRLYVICDYENLQSCGPFSAQVIENPVIRESVTLSLDTTFTFNGSPIDAGTNWLTNTQLEPFLTYDTFYCLNLLFDSTFFNLVQFPSGNHRLQVTASTEEGDHYTIDRSYVFDF